MISSKLDRHPDVEYVIDKLLEYGVLSEDGCSRLAEVFRAVESFQRIAAIREHIVEGTPVSNAGRRGVRSEQWKSRELKTPEAEGVEDDEGSREASEQEDEDLSPVERAISRKLAWDISEKKLRELYESMTAGQIARMNQVSPATVNRKLREYGIKKPGRRRGFQRVPLWKRDSREDDAGVVESPDESENTSKKSRVSSREEDESQATGEESQLPAVEEEDATGEWIQGEFERVEEKKVEEER